MSIITVPLMYNNREIMVTYDDELIDVEVANDGGIRLTRVTFINGYSVGTPANIIMDRDDRNPLIVDDTSPNYIPVGQTIIENGLIYRYAINLNVTGSTTLHIDLTGANLYLNGEPLNPDEPEPEPVVEVVEETETEIIPYDTITEYDDTKDYTETTVQGVDGEKLLTYEVTYTDGVETNRILLSEETTTEPINEVVVVGTQITRTIHMGSSYQPLVELFLNHIDVFVETTLWNYEYDGSQIVFDDIKINSDTTIEFRAKNGRVFEDDLLTSFYNPVLSGMVNINYIGTPFSKAGTVKIDELYSNRTNITPNNFEMGIDERPDVTNSPYIKLYRTDEDILNQLTNYTLGSENDYSKYVTSLLAIPYNIEPVDTTTIVLGDIDTGLETGYLDNYQYTINLGSIHIPESYTQGIGYKNITIDLYVPYFKEINLEVDEVLGNTVTLTLNLNLISGKGTLNIHNSESDSIITVESNQIGNLIPYQLSDVVSVNIGSDVLDTDYKVPFIEMKILRPDNKLSLVGVSVKDVDLDYKFLKDSDDVTLNTQATEREQRMIKDFINRGIFIRKD